MNNDSTPHCDDLTSLSIRDHVNLTNISISAAISKKWTEEHVCFSLWKPSDMDDLESKEYYHHSSIDHKDRRTLLHTFCPSEKLCRENDLKKRFLPRVHPEDCDPVDILNYEIEMAAADGGGNASLQAIQSPIHPAFSVPHNIPITSTYGRSRLGRKRKKPDTRRPESKLFEDALAAYSNSFGNLLTSGSRAPLRVEHFFEENRCFAFASAHAVLSRVTSGCCHPVISIMWQTSERPRRAVAISFSIHFSSNAIRGTCTCRALRSIAKDEDSCCEHLSICYQNEELIDKIEKSLRKQKHSFQQHGRSVDIFGPPISITSENTNPFYAVCLTLLSFRSQTQLTNKNGRQHPWVFWIVFDSQAFVFVPVLKLKGKPFHCFACRLEYGKRGLCNHELACLKLSDNTESDSATDPHSTTNDSDGGQRSDHISDVPENAAAPTQEPNSDQNRGISLYLSNSTRRSLHLCASEVESTENTAILIEKLEPNEVLVLDETDMATCTKCGSLNSSQPVPYLRREVNLFTLSQGTVSTYIHDWVCNNCREKVLFSGQYHGIFPARKESCYTTELMYAWSQMVCLHGFSFREAYRNIKLTSRSQSNTLRFRENGRDNYNADKDSSRNRANEAFRAFLKSVKTDCSSFTGSAFSCSTCEVPLTAEDCDQLDIDPQRAADLQLKRFKAIVIDGTAAGVLNKLPKYTRDFTLLKATRVANSKLMCLAPHQTALSILFKMCTESLRTLRERNRRLIPTLASATVSWWLANCPDDRNSIFTCKKTKMMTLTQARNAMMMCEEDACFCNFSDESHSEECVQLLSNFKEPNTAVSDMLRSVFKVSCALPPSLAENNSEGGAAPHNEEQQENDDDDEDDNEEQEEQDGHEEEQEEEQDEPESQADGSNGNRSSPGAYIINEGSSATLTQRATFSASASTNSFWASFNIPDIDLQADFAEALMALIQFTVLEHISLPYVTKLSFESVGIEPPLSAAHQPHQSLMSSAFCALNLHKKVLDALKSYYLCDRHGGEADLLPWNDCNCVEEIKKWTPLVQGTNPLLETFCIQVTKLRRPLHPQLVDILKNVCSLLQTHMQLGITYLRKVDAKISDDSKQYWANCNFNEAEAHDSQPDDEFKWYESGMCFPGRSQCRPGIKFETKETHQCTKRYPKSETHSPGLLTVQCACENPKLIGFIIMTRAESTSLALFAILMYFPLPPRTVYYDNACNMFASIFLRLPWLLSRTRVAVDRFHYKGHTCSPFFSPDSYQVLDRQRTETAESFNAQIDKSLYHMRYLGADNLIPFLYNRLAHLNVSALFKEKYKRQDLEDEDLPAFPRTIYTCTCSLCLLTIETPTPTPNDGGEQLASDPPTTFSPDIFTPPTPSTPSTQTSEETEDSKQKTPEANTNETQETKELNEQDRNGKDETDNS